MEPGAPVGSLSLEPELEVGRSWWELALDRPGWPEIPLSYEHRYREGTRSLTSGSAAAEGAVRRLIWPAHQHIDEQMHLLRLRAGHEIGSWRLEDELRLQWTDFRTGRTNSSRVPPESDDRRLTRISEAHQSFQAANAFRFERRFRPWLRSTGGYLYSRYDADGTFQLWDSPLSPSATLLRRWRSPAVIVQQTTHAANANWAVEPGRGWSCLAGLQAEWTRQQGLGRAFLEYEWAPDDWLVLPASQEHARDRVVLSEFVGLRWTGRKPVTFYADLKAEQDSVDLFEEQWGGDAPFRRDTWATGRAWDGRVGLEDALGAGLGWGAAYRHRRRHVEWDHRRGPDSHRFWGFSPTGLPGLHPRPRVADRSVGRAAELATFPPLGHDLPL